MLLTVFLHEHTIRAHFSFKLQKTVMKVLLELSLLPMTMSLAVGVLDMEPCDTAASLQPDTPENFD